MSGIEQASGPSRSVSVRIGTRTIAVDASSLATYSTSYRNRSFSELHPGCVVIRPSTRARVIGGIVSLVVTAWIAAAVFAVWHWPREPLLMWCFATAMWILGIAVGLLLILIFGSSALSLWQARFDVNTGQFTHGVLGFRRGRPLSDIVAFQVLPHEGTSWPCYELNVVLDDVAEPRVNLSNHGDAAWTLQAATRLGDVLGVGLVNLIPDEVPAHR